MPSGIVSELDQLIKPAFPDVDIKWYHSGSERIQVTLEQETNHGVRRADMVTSADPFYFLKLKEENRLMAYSSPLNRALSADLRDPDDFFATFRFMAVVIAYNKDKIKAADAPKTWKDLESPKWDKKISMAAPADSGTALTAVSYLSHQFGWTYLLGLKRNHVLAIGGNEEVITRLATGERPIGLVLLQDLVKEKITTTAMAPVIPEDGPIIIPGQMAILKDTKNPEIAKRIYDWFFSASVQSLFVKEGLYSVLDSLPSPKGAPSLKEIRAKAPSLSAQEILKMAHQTDEVQKQFRELNLNSP